MKIFTAIVLFLNINLLAQTQSIQPNSNKPTLELGRNNGYPTIKALSSGSGNIVMDAYTAGDAVYINHYISANTLISSGGGNVGIGTTSPGSWRLAVNGKIRAKEIKVETGWSDYIFERDYILPTLEEVESYINQFGHLKDIPSGKDVEENGIFLGEMDSKLLQKIEELTLYIIEQNKKINQLNERIDSLVTDDK